MASTTNVTVTFDSEAKRKIDKFTKSIEKAVAALEKLNEIPHIPTVPATDVDEQEPNVMYVVVNALANSGLNEEQCRTAVGSMQQAGIIFVDRDG